MEVNNGAEDRIYTHISFREGMCSELKLRIFKWSGDRFTPISHSGKECVLRVELLPYLKLERKIGFAPISHSGKECVLRVELLPHNIKIWAEDRIYTYISFREGMCSKIELLRIITWRRQPDLNR